MASGNCPRCGIYAEIFKCKYCGDVRCGSTNTKYDNPKNPQKGCGVQGQGSHYKGDCRACRKMTAYERI